MIYIQEIVTYPHNAMFKMLDIFSSNTVSAEERLPKDTWNEIGGDLRFRSLSAVYSERCYVGTEFVRKYSALVQQTIYLVPLLLHNLYTPISYKFFYLA